MTPAPPAVALIAVLVVTVVLCGVALVQRGVRGEPRVVAAETNHLLMALAMVAMAVPGTAEVVPASTGMIAFGLLAAAWVATAVVGGRAGSISPLAQAGCAANPLHLALVDVAMVAMYGGAAVEMASAGATLLLFDVALVALAFYLLVHTGATVGALVSPRVARDAVTVGGGGAGEPSLAPDSARTPLLCEALMSLTMAWMLLAML